MFLLFPISHLRPQAQNDFLAQLFRALLALGFMVWAQATLAESALVVQTLVAQKSHPGFASAHPRVALVERAPDWVLPIEQLGPIGSGSASSGAHQGHTNAVLSGTGTSHADQPSPGFKYRLLDLQHNVLEEGVDYAVHVQKHITTSAGLAQANLEIEFDPVHEQILWQSLEVHREGKIIDVRDRAPARVIDREKSVEAAILFGRKTLFVVVPDVRVGDVIRYQYVLQERHPLWRNHFFLTRYLAWEQPVERYFLRVQWPLDRQIQWSLPERFDFATPEKQPQGWVFQYDSARVDGQDAHASAAFESDFPQAWAASKPGQDASASTLLTQLIRAQFHEQRLLSHYFNTDQEQRAIQDQSSRLGPAEVLNLMHAFDGQRWNKQGRQRVGSAVAPDVVIGVDAVGLDAPKALGKAGQPSLTRVLPLVEFSEFGSWIELASWMNQIWAGVEDPAQVNQVYSLWQSLAQPQFQTPSADPEDRLLEVIHWVQDQVRYFGLELGVGALKPRHPELVLQSRFGDCKDKALLLSTLLKAIGVEAAPVLVHSHATQLPYQLPTPASFNHVIVEIPWGGSRLWVDATRAWQGGRLVEMHVSTFDRGLVLASEPNNSRWQSRPSVDSRHETHVKTRVLMSGQPDQLAALEVTTRFNGQAADVVRGQLKGRGEDWFARGRLAQYQTFYAGIEVSTPLAVSDDRPNNSLVITEHFEIPSPATRATGAEGESSAMDVTKFFADALYPVLKALEAQIDLREAMVPAQHIQHELEIVLPDPNWHISETKMARRNSHFSFSYGSRVQDNSVFLNYQLLLQKVSRTAFRSGLASAKRDIALVKDALVFELSRPEVSVTQRHESGQPLLWQSFLAQGQLLNFEDAKALWSGAVASVFRWANTQLALPSSSLGGTRPASSVIWGIDSDNNAHTFQPRVVISNAFVLLGEYQQYWLANLRAQLALLFCLSVWLVIRWIRRIRRKRQLNPGIRRISMGLFGFLSLITCGVYAFIWLWDNFGTKRRRVRLRYWVGGALGQFPSQSVLIVLLGVTLLGSASLLLQVWWPLAGVGVLCWSFCSRVRALHHASLPVKLGGQWGGEHGLGAPGADSMPRTARKRHAGSAAA